MPDNPHPHPPEFGANVQLFLVALVHLIRKRMLNIESRTTTPAASGARHSTTFFSRSPRD